MSTNKNDGPAYGPFFFLVNKPVEASSFDVIRIFKKHLTKKIGKIGHLGTLDPFADGLMIIGIGNATRLNDWTKDFSKEYIATGVLGIGSNTGDLTGDEFHQDENLQIPDEKIVREVLASFLGEYMQAPHSFSAAKHEGKNLYEWARKGVIIEKEKVRREIFEIELLEFKGATIKFRALCSSGTFIRVLMEDIAQKLGTLGHLTALTRTKIGPHKLEDATTLSDIFKCNFKDEAHRDQEFSFIKSQAHSIEDLIIYPHIHLTSEESVKFARGQEFFTQVTEGIYWVFGDNKMYGLGEVISQRMRVKINFSQFLQ